MCLENRMPSQKQELMINGTRESFHFVAILGSDWVPQCISSALDEFASRRTGQHQQAARLTKCKSVTERRNTLRQCPSAAGVGFRLGGNIGAV